MYAKQEERRGSYRLGNWDGHIHTTVYKIGN